MSQTLSLEERIARIEIELLELKHKFNESGTKKDWIKKVEGTFENRPEFDEVLRLGKEIRDAEQEQYPEE